MASLLKWLGALSGWEAALTAIGAFVTTLIGVIGPVVRAFRKQRALAMAEADKPVAPLPLPPPGVQLPADHTGRVISLLELRVARAEWDLEECRSEYRQARDESERLSRALQTCRSELEQTQTALRLMGIELEAAETRSRAMAGELAELKREIQGGHSGLNGIATPIRPPPSKP